MPSPEFEAVLEILRARASERSGWEHDLAARRQEMDVFGAMTPIPEGVDYTRVDVDGMAMARLAGRHGAGDRAILYLHGGGYCRGSIDSHAGIAARLAQAADAAVYLPDYRLAPEHPFPAALHDALAAYRWIIDELGVPTGSTAVVGDSAGGGLVVATLLSLRASGDELPASGALISPWLDLRVTDAGGRRRAWADPVITPTDLALSASWYLGSWPADDPLVSPVVADLSGLSPLLVHVGTDEVLLDDALEFEAAARRQGASVQLEVRENMIHCWHLFLGTPESDAGIAEISEFLGLHWPATGAAADVTPDPEVSDHR